MAERNPGRTRRFFKLAGMTARVATDFAGSRIRAALSGEQSAEDVKTAADRRAGERIAKTLGELKGAVMKLGQMASITADVLPEELQSALQVLQRDAPPMPFELIAEQIERELGSPPELLFDSFEREPFAAASIGQVHRATTDDGREVVVKVQYPGIDASLDSDLSQFRMALRAGGVLNRSHRKAFDRLFGEFRARLEEELDYCNEADNARQFAQLFADEPRIVIPAVVGERSAQRVLTLEYEPGDHVDVVAEEYPPQLRDELAELLSSTYTRMIFDHGFLHADPNPANLAYRRDGTIVFYDFGCVKEIAPDVRDILAEIMRCALDRDYAPLDEAMWALGGRTEGSGDVEAEFYQMWCELYSGPVVGEQPYDFGTCSLQENALRLAPEFVKRIKQFQPPTEIIFVNRTVGGWYGTMRRLKAHVDVQRIIMPFIEAARAARD